MESRLFHHPLVVNGLISLTYMLAYVITDDHVSQHRPLLVKQIALLGEKLEFEKQRYQEASDGTRIATVATECKPVEMVSSFVQEHNEVLISEIGNASVRN